MARILTRRPLSEKEAAARLEQAGVPRDEIDAALAYARESRWVDDRVFARLWVEDRLSRHPLSRRAIEDELRGRKVSRDVALAALDEHYPPEREREIALGLARERLARLGGIAEDARRRRATDFLIRRGFSTSIAADAVRRALRGEGDG